MRVSRGWERLTGIAAASAESGGFAALVAPGDRARLAGLAEAARAAATGYRAEYRLRFGDGSYRWVTTQMEPVRHHDGTLAGWSGTVADIHDLWLAAQSGLHLLDASDDCVKVLDLDARLISMSSNGQRALAIADFARVEGADWLGFWKGADRTAAEAAVNAARAGGKGRFTGFYPVEGDERWWDVTVTPILGPDGRPERLLAVSRDVTELRVGDRALARSEERYRITGEVLPGTTWTATPDGRLDSIREGAFTAPRKPRETRLGDGWLETVHPDDREATRARWRASLESGEPYELQFRIRMADDSYRWQMVRALPQRDENGAIVRWIGVNVDIDDQRRADEAREQFVRLVEASDDIIAIGGAERKPAYLNAAGRRVLGVGLEPDAPMPSVMEVFPPEDVAYLDDVILPELQRSGRWAGEFRMRNLQTGETIPVWFQVFRLLDDRGVQIGIASVSRDLRERRRIEMGLRTLAETGAAMFRSLDYDETLRNVAAVAATNGFASYCIVDTLDADGSLRRLAAVHRDPAMNETLQRLAASRALRGAHPVARAVYDGISTFAAVLDDESRRRMGLRPAAHPDVAALAARSYLCVPVRSGGNGPVIGALSFVIDASDPRGSYAGDDLRFAEEIAVRAGLAFEHARAYEREHAIAMRFQEASLPRELPSVPGLRLSADYRPGKSEATIGGDWYDAFTLADGRVVVTIGDVLGNGLAAAVTMGKVRQAIRSAAMLVAEPNALLTVADCTVREVSAETYATALAGIYDPGERRFTFASAGHPGPVLRHPDGTIEEFIAPGILLGLRGTAPQETVTIATPPGSTLVFYTDGLTEATRDPGEGARRLQNVLAGATAADGENPAHALVERVLAGAPATDDIAVLVVQVEARTTDRRLRVPARFEEVGVARRAVRSLLAESGATADQVALAEFATGELVANAMEHGSGDAVDVSFRALPESIVVCVRNEGSAFKRAAVDLRSLGFAERGRGLELLRALGFGLEITHDGDACVVTATLPLGADGSDGGEQG